MTAAAPPGATPFALAYRSLTVGVVMMVTVIAFQALGVGTALPDVARDLDGLDAYGWAFSAFLLAAIAGMVVAGQAADAIGPARPFAFAVLTFGAASVLAATAGRWEVLIAARALQGAGEGSTFALVYVVVARAYPAALYGSVMALLSSAWVVPALLGPGLAGIVAQHAGWRWVFLMLLPLLPVAFALALPGLRTLGPPAGGGAGESRLAAAVAVVAGAGAVLGALELDAPAPALALGAAGAAVGVPGLLRLLPAGTLRLRRGLPAGIASRGLLGVGFLGANAFLPLALTRLHGLTLGEAGLVVSAGSVSWAVGAAVQGRRDRDDGGAGRPRRVQLGGAILTAGLALTGAGLVVGGLGWPVAVAGFVLAGLGVGTGYPAVGALALASAPEGAEGAVSSSLQLSETIGVALFSGVAGAVLAAGLERGWAQATPIAVIFAGATLSAAATLVAARRLATR